MKIFGVGLYRTGTSSVAKALLMLGFRVVHHHQFMRMVEQMNRDAGRKLLYGIDNRFDAIFDGSLYKCFQELDRQYPGSRFICTTRDAESWLRSLTMRRNDDLRRGARTIALHSPAEWLVEFHQHYRNVELYFSGREDCLWLDVCHGCGWKPLCDFVGAKVPDVAFPHENKSSGHGPVEPFWQMVS